MEVGPLLSYGFLFCTAPRERYGNVITTVLTVWWPFTLASSCGGSQALCGQPKMQLEPKDLLSLTRSKVD